MNKKKILHCVVALRNAGAQAFIMNIYRNIDREKYQFDFLIRCKNEVNDEKLVQEIKKLGGNIYTTASFPRHILKNFREVNYFLYKHKEKYDAIHIHMNSFLYIIPLILAKKYSIPKIIIHSHNSMANKGFYTPLHYINRKIFLKYATDYVACSELAGKWMFGKRKYILLKNGIDLEKFLYDPQIRKEVREELGLGNQIVIGNIGRFTKQKNHDYIIQVFEKYLKRNPNSVLVLAGIGELENSIRKLVKQKELVDYVIFLGLREDAYRLYNAFDIFLMPSKYEGLPFTLIEAQASGLPCVISSIISDEAVVTKDVVKGDLEGDCLEWVYKLEKIFQSFVRKNTMKIMQQAGFDIKTTIEDVKKLYKE